MSPIGSSKIRLHISLQLDNIQGINVLRKLPFLLPPWCFRSPFRKTALKSLPHRLPWDSTDCVDSLREDGEMLSHDSLSEVLEKSAH